MQTGTVQWFNAKKGIGIIISEQNQEYFFSEENVDTATRILADGEKVSFFPMHQNGRWIATQVRPL